MDRRWAYFLAAAGLEICLAPPAAQACDSVGFRDHPIDTALQTSDRTPPVLVSPPTVNVMRGQAAQDSGCLSVSSCDGAGTIVIGVEVSDDQSPPEKIGFRLSRLAGTLPRGSALPLSPVEPPIVGQLMLGWDDGTSDDKEPLDFTLGVAPIDAAGNQGLITAVRIQHPGNSGGCGIAGRNRSPGMAALAALLFAYAWVRRRSRNPRRAG